MPSFAYIGVKKPHSGAVVQDRCWEKDNQGRKSNKDDGIIYIHRVAPELMEVKPHHEAQKEEK